MKITIRKADLRFRAFRSSGPGGQNRNKVFSAIEVTHLPTGLKATACRERSQYQNKKAALRVLVARIYAHYETPTERFRAPETRVRNYHEPDNRVTICASGEQFSYRNTIGKGDLGPLIEASARAAGG